MPMVYLKCDVTGNLVPTNHIVPTEKMLKAIDRNLPVQCPFCNSVHIWTDGNGFFLEPADEPISFAHLTDKHSR